jgi:SH3-like domain-containing protein
LRKARVTRWIVVCAIAAVQFGATLAVAAEKSVPAKAPAAAGKAVPAKPEPPKKDQSPTAQKDATGVVADEEPAKTGSGGLPIPRFVSLRTSPINLRTGPGVRYPVDWVYTRRHLPVEVIGEFDTWRRVKDSDGAEGWVHQSMLSGRRTAVVTGAIRPLRRDSADTAETVATVEPGVVVNVQRCPTESGYCRVEISGLQGWLKREQLWGVYPDEIVQ